MWLVELATKKKRKKGIGVMGREEKERGDRKTRPCDSSTLYSCSLSLFASPFSVLEREN